jgi:hypothetical protein
MTKPTPKRIAADILRADLDLVSGYWEERWENMGIRFTEPEQKAIQAAMDDILAPFLDRLDTIAKDVDAMTLSRGLFYPSPLS